MDGPQLAGIYHFRYLIPGSSPCPSAHCIEAHQCELTKQFYTTRILNWLLGYTTDKVSPLSESGFHAIKSCEEWQDV